MEDKGVDDYKLSSRDSLRRFWAILAPRKWTVLGLSLLLSVSASLAAVGPQFARIVFDELIPRGEVRPFLWLGGVMLLFYGLYAVIGYMAMYYSYAFTQAVISDVRMKAYGRLLSLPITRFHEERSGSLVSRVVSDVNALEAMIQSGSSRLLGQLFTILVIVVILFATNARLALVTLVIVPLLALITWRYQGPLKEASRAIRRRIGELSGVATEATSNIEVVKTFAAEAQELRRFKEQNDGYVMMNLSRRKQVGWMESLISLTSDLGLAAMLLGGGLLIVGGSMTVGVLTAFLLYLRQLMGPVQSVMFFNNTLQAGVAALERITDLLEAEPESGGSLTSRPGGDLVIDRVSFGYPGTALSVLDKLSLRVRAGETAALVGPSGAGKTTVIKLLSRLYNPGEGQIVLGGHDLREYELATLRRAVAVVPQDPVLFSGSVFDNIRYALPEAGEAEVRRAAELANAHRFILDLPKGYATEVGERGVKLSGGQKQRIAIARALLKDASVLVLDEATSNLDAESESIIQDALSGLFSQNRLSGRAMTTVIIAHRLATVTRADTIFVLERGRVAESGSHPQLLAKRGLYRMLYDLQFQDQPGSGLKL
ncbi:MAG: ABC transporter ATP-binding protein/permease [Deinococcota bacterium]|nr:ABC transporter ATP-binding protein/permease [Deinococcota bacterium]